MTVSAADFWDRLQSVDSIAAVRALAGVNIGLEIDRLEPRIQHAATGRYIRPQRRPLSAPGDKHTIEGAFFARAGVLVAIKSLIATADPTSPPPTFDPYVVGDLSLDANEVAFANPKADAGDLDNFDVAVQFVSTWDLYNPRFVGYAVARAYRMIELFQGTDDTVATLRARLKLDDPQSLDFDGLSVGDFGAVTFGLFAHVRVRAEQPNTLIRDPGGWVIDSNTFLSQTSLSRKTLEKFLLARSLTFDGFREQITGGERWNRSEFTDRVMSAGFGTDFRAFRRYPLMNLGAGQHLILDLQFLEDLPASGLFFHLLTRLDTTQRKVLFDLWGRIFELLVIELFRHFYPDSLVSPFRADYSFGESPSDNVKAGQVDGLLDFGKEVLLFELKHFLLSQDVKDSLDRTRLETELRLKLVEDEEGKPKAVMQLVNLARAVRKGLIPTAAGASTRSGANAVLYPVVVVADAAMEAFGVNSFLNDIFQQHTGEIEGEVRPLTVMSIQELEEVLAYTEANVFTWGELLQSRFTRAPGEDDGSRGLERVSLLSVHQAICDLLSEKCAGSLPNKFRKAQFDQIAAQIRSKYSGDGMTAT